MAGEVVRVGKAGWIQTPAWEFPIEPHFHVPFMHWSGTLAAEPGMLLISELPIASAAWTRMDVGGRVEHVYLLLRRELRELFPGMNVHVERLILAQKLTPHSAKGIE